MGLSSSVIFIWLFREICDKIQTRENIFNLNK